MLSKTFKSAKELKISQAKLDTLVKVYWMLVDERIPESLFTMNSIGSPLLKGEVPCGTPGCILGWCQAVDNDAKAFPLEKVDFSGGLERLFFAVGACNESVTRAQAAQALHNYLTTGAARWARVLKD